MIFRNQTGHLLSTLDFSLLTAYQSVGIQLKFADFEIIYIIIIFSQINHSFDGKIQEKIIVKLVVKKIHSKLV